MTFTSLGFLLFFPAVCLLYYLLPAPARPAWLLAASYWFYACADWRGPLLLLATTAVSYGCGRALGALRSPRARRAVLAAAAVGFVGVLALFKYAGFALESLAALLHLAGIGWQPPAFSLLLPLGISFTTFQILGYLTDVYRGALAPERSFVRYALFLSFFPQIVSGPIARGGALLPQLARPVVFLPDRVRDGLVRMLWGYFEKLVVADQAALVVNTVFADYAAHGGVERLLAAVLYSVQIYTDFAGYSHIALGAAQVLGFTLGENFRQPYLAQSVREFWGRWHISLSGWLRDYLYIPLGGSRAGTLRRYANLLVTFLVSGLWHGAAWHYVVWGGLHAAYQIASLLTAPLRRRCNLGRGVLARWARRGVTFGLVTAAWVFFRADSAGQALSYLGGIAGWFDPWVLTDGTLLTLGLDGWGWFVLFCAVGLVLAVDCLRERGVRLRAVLARQPLAYRWLCYYALLAAVLVFGIWGPGYSAAAFVYFQF